MGKCLTVQSKTVKALNQWKSDINNGLYRPYLTVRKVNKVGRRHWVRCLRQKRDVHLLSDGERRAYSILLNTPGTLCVMEQFALDIDETMEIALESNVIHPRNFKTGEAHVMSTDFVVKRLASNQSSVVTTAYTFKYSDKIFEVDGFKKKAKSHRTWEKFGIEREYWNRRQVEYRVITELDATKERFWNVQFCSPAAQLEFADELINGFLTTFQKCWFTEPNLSLQILANRTALEMNQCYELVMQLFKFTVINELLPLKHDKCIRLFRPVELYKASMALFKRGST